VVTRVVVLGAGSAGCVLASRLTGRPDVEVVLVEAGPDYPDFVAAPHDIRDNSVLGAPDHDWGFVATASGVRVPFFRGKVVGGSSAVNATNALRPLPSDFDRWVARGLPEWSWEHCLPAFVELECDDAPGDWHGGGGRVPIVRYADAETHPLQRSFVQAAQEAGHHRVDDLNEPGAVGVGATPMNRRGRSRMTAARTHLDGNVRSRPNLTVVPDTCVDRLDIRGGRVVAAVMTDGRTFGGDVFVVSAGSIGSPAILMRSGVGGRRLAELGIEQVVSAPAVGQGLREHPAAIVVYEVTHPTSVDTFPMVQTMLTASSGLTDDSPIDLHIIPLTVAPDQLAFLVSPVRSWSTGSVELRSRSAEVAPIIDLALFDDERDRAIVRRGVETVRSIARCEPLGSRLGAELAPAVSEPDALEAAIRSAPSLYYHASCTCRMGAADDPDAVVDPFGQIRGLQGGWVIDASIFPDLPSTPTNLATMMLAQRCADVLLGSL
jgi:choline dehydrogenase